MNAFSAAIRFLLGVDIDSDSSFQDADEAKKHRRRWTPVQAKDFSELHSLVATLVLSCDLKSRLQRGASPKSLPESLPTSLSRLLCGPVAPLFAREAVCACRELVGGGSAVESVSTMLVRASEDDEAFSKIVMEEVMQQWNSINSAELKNLSRLLLDLLVSTHKTSGDIVCIFAHDYYMVLFYSLWRIQSSLIASSMPWRGKSRVRFEDFCN